MWGLAQQSCRGWIIGGQITLRPHRAHRRLMSLIKTPKQLLLILQRVLWRAEIWAPAPPQWWRKDQEFSNVAARTTRSRWCGLKYSLSACVLNASQSKSNPVCATPLFASWFSHPWFYPATVLQRGEKHHIQSKGEICSTWKHNGCSIIITLSNLLNLITTMMSSRT